MGETDAVRRELSKNDVERLFVGAVDGALAEKDSSALDTALAENPELKERFKKYERAISLLRDEPKHKAPDALSSLILRRTRRRRFQLRSREFPQFSAFPAEVVVPMLIAALVALFMMLASP